MFNSLFKKLFILLSFIILVSCDGQDSESFKTDYGTLALRRIADTLNIIEHFDGDSIISQWDLRFPVYRFDYGDLNGNGQNEIVVGVTKKTRYWEEGNRLFIYKLYNGRLIRPLWLGSRLGGEILDFHINRSTIPAQIITTEDYKDSIVTAVYSLGGFGLRFEGILDVN